MSISNNPTPPSQAQIRKLIRGLVFGSKMHCPECGSRKIKSQGQRYYCRDCLCRFSLTSHTYLKGTKLDLVTIWTLAWFYINKAAIGLTVRYTGLSYKAVSFWYDVFRENLPFGLDDDKLLSGHVQVDEAYFGKYQHKRCLLMAKQLPIKKRRLGQLRFQVLPPGHNPTRKDVIVFIRKHLIEDSVTLETDKSSFYTNINRDFRVKKHYRDNHNTFSFKHTSQIEGTFGNFRPFVKRTYGFIPSDKLNALANEFCLRYNHPEIFSSVDKFLFYTLHLLKSDSSND